MLRYKVKDNFKPNQMEDMTAEFFIDSDSGLISLYLLDAMYCIAMNLIKYLKSFNSVQMAAF